MHINLIIWKVDNTEGLQRRIHVSPADWPPPRGRRPTQIQIGLVLRRPVAGFYSAVDIISDNPLYSPYEGTAEEIRIIGRIRWFAREI